MDQRSDGDEEAADPGDRHCPACGTLMCPLGMPSGEIVARCPRCHQIAI